MFLLERLSHHLIGVAFSQHPLHSSCLIGCLVLFSLGIVCCGLFLHSAAVLDFGLGLGFLMSLVALVAPMEVVAGLDRIGFLCFCRSLLGSLLLLFCHNHANTASNERKVVRQARTQAICNCSNHCKSKEENSRDCNKLKQSK